MQNTDYHIDKESKHLSRSYDALTLCISSIKSLENIFHALRNGSNNSIVSSLGGTGDYLAMTHHGCANAILEGFEKRRAELENIEANIEARRNFVSTFLDEITVIIDSIGQLGTLFNAITKITKKGTQDYELAGIGLHLASDWENNSDCIREEIARDCGLYPLRAQPEKVNEKI